ncbi:glycosyltransferase family 4 protein [Mucilaginibacter sp. dw_454]|uniref:glycosyltransferase family 4 protein n=1 Tax=Mucilaginibacter sp. dw_454 TaxID=2720079 RepID=UPI001BD43BE0|nr:glycosyltransferase family 4 protein [Mucilaginibacter sp. dw_454]
MPRLAIITTHPIQYYAPVFKLLHERGHVEIKVFYTWGEGAQNNFDPGFGKQIKWDLPLLDGYPYEWVRNVANDPGSHHFGGIVNPYLNQQIVDWHADAVLVIGWAYIGHLLAIRYFKGKIPVFFRGDSTLLDEQTGFKSSLKKLFLRWVYRHIDYAFYTGTNNKAYFKKYGLSDERLIFAPHAVDNDRFKLDRTEEALALRDKLKVAPNDILLTFAGKFEKKKNPIMLVNAFRQLEGANTHLLLVGNGVLETELKQMAKANKNIHFMDFQNQLAMPVIYQSADLFCLPSSGPGESWGLAVNEAMAAGRAVLVSDKVGCAIDLVNDAANGEIFKNEDEAALTKALQRLTADKEKLKQMGEHSSQLIARWNFEAIALALENKVLEK